MLYDASFVAALFHSSKIIVWREKKRYWIRVVEKGSLRGLLDKKRMNRTELCEVTNKVDKRTDESVL